jgi:hypothetical protein
LRGYRQKCNIDNCKTVDKTQADARGHLSDSAGLSTAVAGKSQGGGRGGLTEFGLIFGAGFTPSGFMV